MNNGDCIIVIDGNFSKSLVNMIILQNSPRTSIFIIAADGSADTLFKYRIIPDYVVGDLDSISLQTQTRLRRSGSKIIKIREQQHNDFEKCASFAIRKGFKNIAVLGYAGKRIDHTLNNFSVLKKFSRRCNIRFLDSKWELFFAKKKCRFKYNANEPISLIPFPVAKLVRTSGLKYPLKNEQLEFGVREGALNRSVSEDIIIEFREGSLLIIRKHFNNLKIH